MQILFLLIQNIVQIFNDKYQSISFFKDEIGKRYDGRTIGKDHFGKWTQKPIKMASEKNYMSTLEKQKKAFEK